MNPASLLESNFIDPSILFIAKIYKANENLFSSLVHTFCVPIIMFGLEAFVLNTSSLHGLDAPFYNVFVKIVNVMIEIF